MPDIVELRWKRAADGKTRVAVIENLNFIEASKVFEVLAEIMKEVQAVHMGTAKGNA